MNKTIPITCPDCKNDVIMTSEKKRRKSRKTHVELFCRNRDCDYSDIFDIVKRPNRPTYTKEPNANWKNILEKTA